MILLQQKKMKEGEWGVAKLSKEEWDAAVLRANERVQRSLASQMSRPFTISPFDVDEAHRIVAAPAEEKKV